LSLNPNHLAWCPIWIADCRWQTVKRQVRERAQRDISSTSSKLCAFDNRNDGYLVITKGIKMRAIFADRHQAARLDRPNMKACPKDGRGPLINAALRALDRRAANDAFDEQISPRDLLRSLHVSGLVSEAAGDIALQSGRGERLFVQNGIVHDIRNVLQVILSGLWVAQDRTREGRADEVPEIFAKIAEAVDRANALLRQLQRPPCPPQERRSAVDIGKMLARLNPSLRWALGASNELVIAVASDLPPVDCTESELENVVLNLVVNARDAMPRGGRATIEATRGPRSSVVLRVHDTGMGMDIGVAAKAFEPYFTTKSAATGTGLGLARVAAFARSIEGSARIEHTSAGGTTMALYLPIAPRT
jgi:signal transduction histidine kinase